MVDDEMVNYVINLILATNLPIIIRIVPSHLPPFPINTDFSARQRITANEKNGTNVVISLYVVTPRYVIHSVIPRTRKTEVEKRV